ncbi:putative MglA, ABC-type sugar transport system,ATPase component [Vibrio nigripulchritudo SFn27]|nr:sugar ABC transporter ATP-binding protein [Vibrio nigripulchritudo]CCN80741.1 putative MglA, ABC-type sugar transport system,ATPase component [Vibrio nigripulchritudo BLFn1]CCN87847.1 putative MglA, ABC-type sugar transport system,ATPase component [Vibrio nigripulchritudo SFn27]CCN93724.1 putative MglA, ABC-type sugar transport system,ATPase component [Vibrio nigripulchritudo ENn2]CCO43095.1 putative MglA, ABC-type sugar transport system,ATPase component [Vibrio nigripulchritudo SFn135]CCO5
MSDSDMQNVVLETHDLSKHFGAVKAVDGLSIKLSPGRVHTILGENGCGKSTTLKMLAGVHSPTRGHIIKKGETVTFKSPLDSREHGIAIIFQELSLCNNLSVAENIYANNEPSKYGVINDTEMISSTKALLDKYKIPISPVIRVSSLSMAQRQLVEIAKGLSYSSEVVIFDEPSSSLSDSEVEILFNIIEELKSEGKAIVYVSHKMAEIMRISDDITVMRDGLYIDTVKKDETNIDSLITMMVGREMNDIYPPKVPDAEIGEAPILRVRSLTNPSYFQEVSFDVKPGEVVGFFGLVGAGRSDAMNAIFGMLPYEGNIEVNDVSVDIDSPSKAIKNGIAFVTENRKEEGLVLDHSVHINCNLTSFEKVAVAGIRNESEEQRITDTSIRKMRVKVHDSEQEVGSLSGGNQQKVVLAKWLEQQPKILILDEPTRGVDVGAKYEIYNIIRDLTALGTAVILVSSELPEALNMSDRLLVMRNKRIVKELDTKGLSQDKVMVYATGVDSDD